MIQTVGYRATAPGSPLERFAFTRREMRRDDVTVRVSHCGVCHSDLSALHMSEVDGGRFPVTPGHEFVGTVVAVGDDVDSFAIGDPVAVGNIVDSCGACDMCLVGQENFCREFPTLTYGGTDRHDGTVTLGAFSAEYVVRDHFVYHLPDELDPAAAAPLMCAGITVWEPLRRWNVGPGVRVGVAGVGGLGHLAVKFAVALGAEVTAFTSTAAKVPDVRALGAHTVAVATSSDDFAAHAGSLDVILDCIPVAHDVSPYLRCLALDGVLCSVGYLGPVTLQTTDLLVGRKAFGSAGSGGRRHTIEMLDFCAANDITADVEVLPSSQVDVALDRLRRGDVRHRFVLDMSDL